MRKRLIREDGLKECNACGKLLNVQVISRIANRMKSNATKEQLIAFAKGILEMFSKEERPDVNPM